MRLRVGLCMRLADSTPLAHIAQTLKSMSPNESSVPRMSLSTTKRPEGRQTRGAGVPLLACQLCVRYCAASSENLSFKPECM